jgi:hypothetical protein
LPVPQELYPYLVLYLPYLARTHDKKQLARLFHMSPRTVAHVRHEALEQIARNLYEREAACTSLQLNAA